MKGCPFCVCDLQPRTVFQMRDDDLDVWGIWIVDCPCCGAQGPPADNEETAIELWNCRQGGEDVGGEQ